MLVSRMRHHGFWPRREPIPDEPAEARADRAEINTELKQLQRRHAAVEDPEKALEAERKRRWEESKKRRAEAKARRAAEAKARRERWAAEKPSRLIFLGEGVSGGLGQDKAAASDARELGKRGLPVLHSGQDLAGAMGIELGELRWLAYHRRGATLVHYHRYDIPKKTGGRRHISAPKPKLAQAQRWILDHILVLKSQPSPASSSGATPSGATLSVADPAHGFLKGRNIVSNATPHVGKQIVINLDVEDFFPTITFRRVKGVFKKLGYSEHLATVLALLTTEPPRVAARFDGKLYHVALGDRRLPQGACTSPALTNLICVRLDRRLQGLLGPRGVSYTRYADDLTFSGDDLDVGKLLGLVRRVLREEGLSENRAKTRVMRRGGRQEVTGVVVNDKPTVSRREVRRLRAILHNCGRHGLASQNRDGHDDFAAHLRGRVAFVRMVDPERGVQLGRALDKALAAG